MERTAADISVNKSKRFGLIVGVIAGASAVALSVVCFPFISPALRKRCLPYVPATSQQITNVLEALKGKSGKLLDIGSGDGRIVLAAAGNGFLASGVELNVWLVMYSKFAAFRSGLSGSATFHRKDLWKFDLRPFNNVIIFGVEEMMDDLEKKFNEELRDTYVVACRFPLLGKVPIKVIGSGVDTVWLYHFAKR